MSKEIKRIEEAVLACILVDPQETLYALDNLKPEHFDEKNHQILYKAINTLHSKAERIDMLTVINELRKANQLDEVGGAYYVTSISQSSIALSSIQQYTLILLDEYVKRTCVKLSSEFLAKAVEPSSEGLDLLDQLEKELNSLRNGIIQKSEKKIGDVLQEVISNCYDVLENGVQTGIYCGVDKFNKVTSGWQKEDLVIIAGRPGMGKTAFAMDCALTPAKNGIPVAVFSLEMGETSLANRILSMESGINVQEINTRNLDHGKIEALKQEAEALKDIPLFIDDTPAITLSDLRNKARRLKRKQGIELIIIDYLQLMRVDHSNKNGNREQEISTISRGLKALAKELKVPVIALSQLSRQVESRSDKKPMLSDLRESGAIEQDADMVVMTYRPSYYDFDTYTLGETEISAEGLFMLLIAKYRNGRTGEIAARYIGENTLVTNHNYYSL